jgi:hypothetical protein
MVINAPGWSLPKRVGFLFLGLFLCLNIFPHFFSSIPFVDELFGEWWLALWAMLIPILGNRALGIEEPIPVGFTGSNDMTWNYVQMLWYAEGAR